MKYGNRNVPKMIGQVETLRQIIRAEGTPAVQDAWDKVEEHIDYAYRADLAQAPAPVRVKPLVWFEVERGQNGYGKWTAEGYTVRKIEGMFLLDFAGESKSEWRFSTAETAKAAAQADYEARILAALEAPDAGVVAELVEALREARTDLAAYVDHDYPPETCATYPSVARQHHRDMELCRRIDAALAKWDAK